MRRILWSAFLLITSGCDADGWTNLQLATPPTPTPVPLTIVSVAPEGGDVDLDSPVTVTFSEPVDPATVDGSVFAVQHDETAVAGSVAIAGSSAVFTPTRRWLSEETFEVAVGTPIATFDGRSLAEPASFDFTTRDLAFGAPLVVTTTLSAAYQAIGVSDAPTSIAVWISGGDVYSSESAAATPWAVAELRESGADPAQMGALEGSPKIAVAADGHAVAVWRVQSGGFINLWAATRAANDVWSSPSLLETENLGNVMTHSVAIAPTGDAFVVWSQSDGTRNNIWASVFTASTSTWSAATKIETSTATATVPVVACSTDGSAIASWTQLAGTKQSVWASRYSGGDWGVAGTVESDDSQDASTPRVSMSVNGTGLLTWRFPAGAWSSQYLSGAGWDTPRRIDASAAYAVDPRPAILQDGALVAVWIEAMPSGNRIRGAVFDVANGWTQRTTIDVAAGDSYEPEIATDARGGAVLTWWQYDGADNRVWATRLRSGALSWDAPTLLDPGVGGQAYYPQVAVAHSGEAAIIWYQNAIWSSKLE